MAKGYRPVSRDQPFLFPPCLRDWLPPDHPVHLVIRVIEEHLDTSAFHAGRRTGGPGTAGYDPGMLVTVLVWAYAHRVTSSRRIEQLCGTDVAFMLICGGNLPDHATIARFRSGFPDAVAVLFAQVLALCARLGMGKLGTVALDGTKITASASKSANKTEGTLRKMAAETVARHGEQDAAEDGLFGPGRPGDEVPEEAWSPRRRDERIAAALAGLRAGRARREAAETGRERKQEERLAAAAAGTPRSGRPLAGTDVEAARIRLEQVSAAQQAKVEDWQARNAASLERAGRPLRGPRPAPASQCGPVRAAAARLERAEQREAARAGRQASRAGPGPVRNLTDPDSRLMKTRSGFIQGYNAQNVVSEDGLIIATELTQDPADMAWFAPMLGQAEEAAALITACRAAAGRGAPGGSPGSDDRGGPGYRPAGDDGQALPYHGPIKLFLADAGYLSQDNIDAPGPARLIATGKYRDLEKAARTPGGEPAAGTSASVAAMTARLKTPDGITAYRQRGHIAETPHGNIKHNMGFSQLSVRGKPKATAEWRLAATVHNLLKAITSGHLTPAALDNLAGYPPRT